MSVKGPTDTVASPVHRLFSSLTMSESVARNIITASLYPEEEERMKIMKGLCLVRVKRERERTRTWILLLLLCVEKTELEMIIGNESNSETEIVSSESSKASKICSCKRLRKREIAGCVNKIETPRQNHPSIIMVSLHSIPNTPEETVQQPNHFPIRVSSKPVKVATPCIKD